MIPTQLKKRGFRFIKVRIDKAPEEREWTTKNNYAHDDSIINNFITNNQRYGVVTGYNKLLVIDFDDAWIMKEALSKLPKTFSVKTAGRGLLHLYYIVDKAESFKILNLNKDTLIDIQGEGKQVIGAGTLMGGKRYQVVDDIEITKTTMTSIKAALSKWMDVTSKVKKDGLAIESNIECKLIKDRIKLPELLSRHGVDTSRNPTGCPFHSSKGGKCFSFNDDVWHCFHCEESGNIFHFLMKVNNCSFVDAKKELAKEAKVEYKVKESKDIGITYKFLPEILSNPIPEPKWQIHNLVPEGGITYIASPPGEGKTMLCLYMAQCISAGKPFLNRESIPGKVIYFDAENGEICLYNRLKRIAEGHDFTNDDLKNMAVSVFPQIRFNIKDSSYANFNRFCTDFQPDVIIFDSLVRYMEGSENDAESCKMVFDYLRSWLKMNPKLTIIILHHLSKHNEGGMNALRGSSEIAASASSIMLLRRFAFGYKLVIEKSRYLDMSKEQKIGYTITDTENGLLFNPCETQDLPSDAVGRAEQDFWEWVEEFKIKDFQSAVCQSHLQTKGHSKFTTYKMIRDLLKESNISKLSRGHYEVFNSPLSTTESVE